MSARRQRTVSGLAAVAWSKATARVGPTATLLADSGVLSAGGLPQENADTPLASAELFR